MAKDIFNALNAAMMGRRIEHEFPITPDDDLDLDYVTQEIWVTYGGDITTIAVGDDTPVTKTVPGMKMLSGGYRRVMSTGTTASGLIGRT